MEIRLDLRTATLKDAEHAIFLIGAYFGLTQARVADVRVSVPGQDVSTGAAPGPIAYDVEAVHHIGAPVQAEPVAHGYVEQDTSPAAAFAPPPIVPQGVGETPMAADPVAVFTAAPVAPTVAAPGMPTPSPATGAPSVPPVAGPDAGNSGNVVGVAAGNVGSPSAVMTPPVVSSSPATPAGVELDADGLPWDGRIHASGEGGGKPKNADGRWRKKRGLNDGALVAQVQAELRATLAAGQPVTPPPVAAVAPTPPASPAPVVQPQAPAEPAAVPQTFEQLMPRVTAAMMAGTLPQGALVQAVQAYGVPTVPGLANRPDLVPTVWAYLRSMYPALV